MDIARFSGEDDRRRFYGEDDGRGSSRAHDHGRSYGEHDRAGPYSEDARARGFEGVDFGLEWRVLLDPAAVYVLRWIRDTREIYAMRRPKSPLTMNDDATMASAWPLPVANIDFGVELLGWAEDLDTLEDALEGWELQMPADDSLTWVRLRLAEAAAETERRRGPGAAGWWPE